MSYVGTIHFVSAGSLLITHFYFQFIAPVFCLEEAARAALVCAVSRAESAYVGLVVVEVEMMLNTLSRLVARTDGHPLTCLSFANGPGGQPLEGTLNKRVNEGYLLVRW